MSAPVPSFTRVSASSSDQHFDNSQYMRGSEGFFMDLYINKSFAHQLIGKITENMIDINLLLFGTDCTLY